jgi:hypothetical protein
MQDQSSYSSPRSAFLPPWAWTRRQLIARSSHWFSVFPRTFKPEVIELCRSLARSRQPYQAVARPSLTALWPLSDLPIYGEQLLTELVAGSGIAYIAGLCSGDSDPGDEVLRWVYLLLGMQLGVPLSAGSLLLDIGGTNACGRRPSVPDHAQPETAFHTDSGPDGVVPDLVGTLCLQPAVQGGEYQVSSALRAREVMWGRCRHLLEELYEPWIRAGIDGEPNRAREPRRPVFAYRQGLQGLQFDYARPGIEAGHRQACEPLNRKQELALDYLDEALNDPVGCVHFQMKRGDMLFVNNRLVAHNRRPFVDGIGTGRRRMVRMWLAMPRLPSLFVTAPMVAARGM